jgi:hypothetical protein
MQPVSAAASAMRRRRGAVGKWEGEKVGRCKRTVAAACRSERRAAGDENERWTGIERMQRS